MLQFVLQATNHKLRPYRSYIIYSNTENVLYSVTLLQIVVSYCPGRCWFLLIPVKH